MQPKLATHPTQLRKTILHRLCSCAMIALYLSITTVAANASNIQYDSVYGAALSITSPTGSAISLQRDAFGRQAVTMQQDNNQINLNYDIRGRRIQKTSATGTTTYTYNAGLWPLATINEQDQIDYHIMGPDGLPLMSVMNSLAKTVYPVKDRLHSARLLIQVNGGPLGEYSYSTMGRVTESDDNTALNAYPFRYQSHEYDSEFDLHNFIAREYSANMGRFLSMDPGHQSVSPYTGMLNNWPNGTDLTGATFQQTMRNLGGLAVSTLGYGSLGCIAAVCGGMVAAPVDNLSMGDSVSAIFGFGSVQRSLAGEIVLREITVLAGNFLIPPIASLIEATRNYIGSYGETEMSDGLHVVSGRSVAGLAGLAHSALIYGGTTIVFGEQHALGALGFVLDAATDAFFFNLPVMFGDRPSVSLRRAPPSNSSFREAFADAFHGILGLDRNVRISFGGYTRAYLNYSLRIRYFRDSTGRGSYLSIRETLFAGSLAGSHFTSGTTSQVLHDVSLAVILASDAPSYVSRVRPPPTLAVNNDGIQGPLILSTSNSGSDEHDLSPSPQNDILSNSPLDNNVIDRSPQLSIQDSPQLNIQETEHSSSGSGVIE